MGHLFKGLLIANRGEIACRIISTAQHLGLRTVAVYSDADAQALHVIQADAAIRIGAAAAAESYLNQQAIINAALSSGCDAIHPGYGFLSENPDFVDACNAAGLTFIGPSAASIRAMGLKDAAKELMQKAGVPVVPGYHGGDQQSDVLANHARSIGYPVLIKARAGGGGKGLRRVDSPDEFAAALQSARREAAASFADDHVLIEKFIQRPRHIEIQIFGDSHGNVVHLFERDCSLQRRHQKVIEEAPAPGMTDAMRTAMTDAAITAAKAIDYVGAGTVEFIVDGQGELRPDGFWFMEMNTRLQVEHPVTESITGHDLVEWQLRIAAGEPLPETQMQQRIYGHAVEARLYAEDVPAGFLPAVGTVHHLHFSDQGRVDSGIQQGDEILPHYDPLLAKLIAHGNNRGEALQKLAQQLARTEIIGTVTNREFLQTLCTHPKVLSGQVDTGLIDEHFARLIGQTECAESSIDTAIRVAAVALVSGAIGSAGMPPATDSIAATLGNWQLWGEPVRHLVLRHQEQSFDVQIKRTGTLQWQVAMQSISSVITLPEAATLCRGCAIDVDGYRQRVVLVRVADALHLQINGTVVIVLEPADISADAQQTGSGTLVAPMPGRVTGIYAAVGDTVNSGTLLLTLEAMKMEQSLVAPCDGVISSVQVEVDDQVSQGSELLCINSTGIEA